MSAKFYGPEVMDVYGGDLTQFLRKTGDDSVASFLRRFPGVPLVDLPNKYPDSGLCAAGIVRAQMREAAKLGRIREAAIDVLVRNINWNLPDGWGVGERLEFRTAGAIVWLLGALELDARAPHLREVAKRVWDALLAQNPPIGWRPASPDDPLIQEAFARGWPEAASS